MKHLQHYILLIVLITLSACRSHKTASLTDFTVDVYTPEYASGFDIAGSPRNASLLLTIRNPWQGAQDIQQQVFLTREGEQAPKEFAGQVVHTPARRVICMSSSYVAMFDVLGQMQRVAGVSGIDYISNTYVNEHRLCGEVQDVGHDTNMNFELIAAIRPDVVLLYGVTGENPAVTGKLRELGIPYIYIGDYVEESPLGKAEWLVSIAALCGDTEQGAALFIGIRDRYNTLKFAAEEHASHKPRVMLNTPYRDTWFMPSSRSYMVQLLRDAGGEYIYTTNESNTSVPISIEEAYLLAQRADLWLNVGQYTTLDELQAANPKFATTPAVLSGQVYNNNARRTAAGGSDFWESGVVAPDRVLADLIGIIQGKQTAPYYYHRLQ